MDQGEQQEQPEQQAEKNESEQIQTIKQIEYPTAKIEIGIKDLIIKDGGLGSKYTAYLIKGSDNLGVFETFRRYNDFFELHEVLIKKWPGCYLPPIPEKVLGSGNDQETVLIRKRLMEIFLTVISELPYIYYSDDIQQTFLRSTAQDIAKSFSSQKQPTTIEIIDRLKSSFPNLEVRDSSNSEYMLQISSFQGQLRKSAIYLKTYIEQSQLVAMAKKQLQDEKSNLYQATLPFYEKVILSEYVCGKETSLVICNPQNAEGYIKILDNIRENNKKFNSMDNITDLFRYELKDAESMQNTLAFREQLLIQRAKQEQKMREDQAELAKITAGKQTLTTITNSVFNKSKDQAQIKVEQKISEGQQEIERLSQLYNIITAIIATREIEKFRQTRINHYHKFFKQIQQQEQQAFETENQLYEKIKEDAEKLLSEQN